MAIDPLSLDFGRDKKFYVYLYRDPRPQKRRRAIYVGKGLVAPKRADIHWAQRSHNPILRAILDKVRECGLEPIIEIVGWFDEEDAAFACEAALIANFGRRDLATGSLTNMTAGGDGAVGRVSSRESIERTRAAHLGAKRSSETRAKQRARWTPERRAAQAARRLGVPQSDTAKGKQSAAMKGRKRSAEAIRATSAKLRGRTLSSEMRREVGAGIKRSWTPERRAAQAIRMSAMRKSGQIASLREIGRRVGE